MNKIYEIKNYSDKTGRIVVKYEAQNGKTAEFFGHAAIMTEDRKKIPVQFPFSSEIKTAAACFENFDAVLKAFIQKSEAEIEAKKQSVIASPTTTSEPSEQEGGKILQFKRPE